ncbi:MAG: hypothetical protein IJT02_06580 [Synergistaceae bacterium]|nr:hypothetical protein [Synergistaceae bacterium]
MAEAAEYEEGGLGTPEELRNEIKLVVDYIPERKLGDALIMLEDMLEFNKETEEALEEAMREENLIGPFYSAEEMMQAVMAGDDDDDDD